jgi:hypothetical protein
VPSVNLVCAFFGSYEEALRQAVHFDDMGVYSIIVLCAKFQRKLGRQPKMVDYDREGLPFRKIVVAKGLSEARRVVARFARSNEK